MIGRRHVLFGLAVLGLGAMATPQGARLLAQALEGTPARDPAPPEAAALIAAAEAQVGVTRVYDPAYVTLAYPGGDVPRDRGVCTDVVIRALRDGLGIDLQQAVHEDMRASFAKYPRRWGLARPDRNIDHRRVPNLETFLTRAGAALPVSDHAADYLPGDIVSSLFPDGQTHIMIVTNRRSRDGQRLLIVHNVGAGSQIEDRLFEWHITGHFRLTPDQIAHLGGAIPDRA